MEKVLGTVFGARAVERGCQAPFWDVGCGKRVSGTIFEARVGKS